MTDKHPITPPRELVREWSKGCSPYDVPADHIATQAARWGADQELEACCEWLGERDYVGSGVCGAYLRAARRPKPPSLAEEALAAWTSPRNEVSNHDDFGLILRALERLQELEKGNE